MSPARQIDDRNSVRRGGLGRLVATSNARGDRTSRIFFDVCGNARGCCRCCHDDGILPYEPLRRLSQPNGVTIASPKKKFRNLLTNGRSFAHNSKSSDGAIAQLVEHLNGIEGVSGSNPLSSIKSHLRLRNKKIPRTLSLEGFRRRERKKRREKPQRKRSKTHRTFGLSQAIGKIAQNGRTQPSIALDFLERRLQARLPCCQRFNRVAIAE